MSVFASKPLTPTSTAAFTGTHAIRLSPLRCPYCQHELRAVDVEPLGNGEARLVCPGCYTDILSIERR
jgi:hypothetical protein